jgi:hypothetical protein
VGREPARWYTQSKCLAAAKPNLDYTLWVPTGAAGNRGVRSRQSNVRGQRSRRLLIACTAASIAAGVGSRPAAAGQRAQGSPTSKTGDVKAGRAWTPPRTPWGDPDLRGTYSNGEEYATPLERPDRFAGRRLEDIKDTELVEVRRDALQRTIDTLPGGRVRGPDYWWVTNLHLGQGSRAWLVVDPPDGKIPALTAEAQARATRIRSSFLGGPFDSADDLGLLDRCISRSVPGSMIPVMYGNTYDIVQVPGYVVITYEIIHETRIIPLDGRPHVGKAIRQHMGDARGHFEGDTLVVETTNFTKAAAYRGATEGLRVIERFSRVAPDRIAWTAMIDDPATWTRPWTIGLPLTRDPQPVMAFECHEGNYGLRNILSAARANDKAPDR